jgi:hypothetical protein
MLSHLKLKDILFLDIETVPQYASYSEMPEKLQFLWDKKALQLKNSDDETPELLYDRAGIYAEFGKIVCISVGFVTKKDDKHRLRVTSYFGDDEKALLVSFFELLNGYYHKSDSLLCGHNAKEFDFPYIARRGLIHGLKLPKILHIAGKKPWEIKHIDTMELWKFGDYKSYTSLDLLTTIFNIPTPKDDIDGSMVGSVYWQEKNLERIVEYCQKDVVALVQLFLRLKGEELITDENISFV